MSFQPNTDSFDTTNRREGFNDTQGGTESYGTGTGSGAYDPANTGLGGYGGQRAGAQSQQQGLGGMTGSTDDTTGQSGGFNPDYDASQSGDLNTTWDKSKERNAGFQGSDADYAQTDSGRTFASGGTPMQSGTFGGQGAQGAQGGGTQSFRATDNLDEVNDQIDQTYAQGQSERERDRSQRDAADSFDQGNNAPQEREGGKPGFGDKMRGTAEKLAGSVMGNQGMKTRGQERKEGDLN